jgi:hypothetical protein
MEYIPNQQRPPTTTSQHTPHSHILSPKQPQQLQLTPPQRGSDRTTRSTRNPICYWRPMNRPRSRKLNQMGQPNTPTHRHRMATRKRLCLRLICEILPPLFALQDQKQPNLPYTTYIKDDLEWSYWESWISKVEI